MNDSKVVPVAAPAASSNQPSYEIGDLRAALGLVPGQPFNLGALLSNRLCDQGHGGRLALIWENHAGLRQNFTFDELRRYSDVWAAKLAELGIAAGDRVCLFLDRVPDLYFAFLGILKLGAVAQPLFSQFMADALELRLADADTRAVITTARHVEKVRSARDWRERHGARYLIEVDGGISSATAPQCRAAGADVFVAGNAIYAQSDPRQALEALRAAVR